MTLNGKYEQSQGSWDRAAVRLTTAVRLILTEPGWKIKETAASSWDIQEPQNMQYDARWLI